MDIDYTAELIDRKTPAHDILENNQDVKLFIVDRVTMSEKHSQLTEPYFY
jgi:hypothetical protein